MSSKEKNYKKIMIITIVTSIIVVLGTVSYAFYQTAINGRVSGTIAKWSFTANNQTDSFDLNLGELYPGKSGTYNITLSAESSDLDVYYELIFTGADIDFLLYWDSSYTKPVVGRGDGSYVGKYGVITKGSSITIPIYFNWPYDSPYDDNGVDYYYYNENLSIPEIKIIAKQYTGYSGSIPMNLLGFTNLISYNEIGNGLVIPIKTLSDQYGYGRNYKFEAINSTSGYILNGSF